MQDILRTRDRLADQLDLNIKQVQPLLVGDNLITSAPAPFNQVMNNYQLANNTAAIITRIEGRCATVGAGVQQTREFPDLTFFAVQTSQTIGSQVLSSSPLFQPIDTVNQDMFFAIPQGLALGILYEDLNILAAYKVIFTVIGFQLRYAAKIDPNNFQAIVSQIQG